jgi:hypothetical protein
MASSNQPFLSTKDPTFNVNTPVFARYDTNMSVEMLPEEDEALQTLENVILGNVIHGNVVADDVEDAHGVDAYISKLHLTNLEKQHATWKFHNCNSPMWVFF